MAVNFLTNLGAKQEQDTKSSWLSILQKNVKSVEQMQLDMIKGTSNKIEKVIEEAKEKAEEEEKLEEAVTLEISSGTISTETNSIETTTSTVEIEA